MKGKIVWINHRTFPDKKTGNAVDVWDMILDGQQGKKYTTYHKEAVNWKVGDETPEFTEQKTGDFFDQSTQCTVENFRMNFPKPEGQGFKVSGGYRGHSPEDRQSIEHQVALKEAVNLTVAFVGVNKTKDLNGALSDVRAAYIEFVKLLKGE